jgi:hypothetical protein
MLKLQEKMSEKRAKNFFLKTVPMKLCTKSCLRRSFFQKIT